MWHHAVQQKFTDTSSIFRIEEHAKQVTPPPKKKNCKQRPLDAVYVLGLPFNPEAGGNICLQNVSKLLLTTCCHICFSVKRNKIQDKMR
jgi:hypothetical protein